jgi:hypothetical protein
LRLEWSTRAIGKQNRGLATTAFFSFLNSAVIPYPGAGHSGGYFGGRGNGLRWSVRCVPFCACQPGGAQERPMPGKLMD